MITISSRIRAALPVVALVSSLLLVQLASPTQAQSDPAAEFEGSADVVEVQIPVNLVTRDGEPVRGLTVDDFELFDRGEKQEITGFEVIDLSVVEPGPRAEQIDAAVPAIARRHFLLLFDLSFSQPASIIRARDAARDFVLDNLHPTDLVAVATFSIDSGLQLLVTFTPDRAQLARAIDTLGAPRLLNRADIDPLRFIIEDPELTARDGSFGADLGSTDQGRVGSRDQEIQAYLDVINEQMTRQEKSYRRGRVAGWLTSLESLGETLSSVEGRKHVVLFSEGFDGRLMLGRAPDGDDASAAVDQQQLSNGQYWMVDTDDIYGNSALQVDVLETVKSFLRSDTMIQAVDISGLGSASTDRRRARRSGQDALFYVANETGGELFEDANQFGPQLLEVLERSSVTYLLAFRPQGIEPDGSYHRVKVEAAVPRGVSVRHRDGYFAPRPFDELHPMERALLASDAIASAAPVDDVAIDVLAAPFRATPQSAYVPVIVEVEGRTLLFGHDTDQLPIEFFTYVSNNQGEMQDFFTQLVTIDLERGEKVIRETGVKYYGHLDLAPGSYLVRTLVRNASTGRSGVASVRVEVPAYELATPDVLPPFFIEEPNRWVMVRESRSSDGTQSVVYPFTVNGTPYVPAARPILVGGESASFCLVAYNLADGAVEIDGTIVGADGSERTIAGLSLVERTVTGIEGLDKLLAEFDPSGLGTGDYTLNVAVKQPGDGIERASSIQFTID